MRHLALLIATALPLAAQAEPMLIRIEAKKSGAAEAAQGWAERFPDVVTFALKGGWTAVALGPMERADAEARMAELKTARKIPADAFLAPVEGGVTPVQGSVSSPGGDTVAPAAPTDGAGTPGATADAPAAVDGPAPLPPPTPGSTMPASSAAAAKSAPADSPNAEATPQADPEATAESGADTAAAAPAPEAAAKGGDALDPETPNRSDDAAAQAAALAAQQPPAETGSPAGATPPDAAAATDATPEAPGEAATHYIRLQSLKTRDEADAALSDWRKDFPAAAMYQLSNGWFAITLGPVSEPVAADWLKAFKAAGRAPKDAFVTSAEKLGTEVVGGASPDLPPAGGAAMPSMDQVQAALRWGGYYDGAVDGKGGPRTQQAIAAAVVAERLAPDAGAAMVKLIEKRAAWRETMGLSTLEDAATGLAVSAPMQKLMFDRQERALSIYGPKDESGAALILFSQPGGQQEMLDLTGLVTALGWVPSPKREISAGHALLRGQNDTHIGYAEASVTDGHAQGFVLIWPLEDAADQPRVAAEIAQSLHRFAPAQNDQPGSALTAPASSPATPAPEPATADQTTAN